MDVASSFTGRGQVDIGCIRQFFFLLAMDRTIQNTDKHLCQSCWKHTNGAASLSKHSGAEIGVTNLWWKVLVKLWFTWLKLAKRRFSAKFWNILKHVPKYRRQYDNNPLFSKWKTNNAFCNVFLFKYLDFFYLFSTSVSSTMNLLFVSLVYSLNLLSISNEQNIRYFESAIQR